MSDSLQEALAALRPTRTERVMDLVEAAGIDVSPWGRRADGSLVDKPAANPSYCYDWSFGGNGQPTALCIWHPTLKESDGYIVYEANIREEAILLARVGEDQFRSSKEKSRAQSQAVRAQEFDRLVQGAFRRSEVVRVITLLGDQRSEFAPGEASSKVDFRYLDPEPWYVESYTDNGFCRLVRGGPKQSPAAQPAIEPVVPADVPKYIDQFSPPNVVEPQEVTGLVYPRSPIVRQAVLLRAKGVCELCGIAGFETTNGAIYLETHHVIALCEDGPDTEWNIVALCPNDHRRAHYASDRANIRGQLIAHLVGLWPIGAAAVGKRR